MNKSKFINKFLLSLYILLFLLCINLLFLKLDFMRLFNLGVMFQIILGAILGLWVFNITRKEGDSD